MKAITLKTSFIYVFCVLLLCMTAYATDIAVWTGKRQWVTTITGKRALKCEYHYYRKKFWKLFPASQRFCPVNVEIE